jgi:hypothetical protein
VVIAKDFTASSLTVDDEVRWGHEDPFTVNLIEPNVGQDEPPLPVVGKMMTVHLTGLLGSISYPAGPTDLFGNATITPFMTLPPGNYEATTCFTEDPWFLGSCSAPQPVKVTVGFSAFARGGPISISGGGHTSLGDMHSETSIDLSGNAHVLSAGTDERMEYVTTLLDGSTGSTYNDFQITAFGISPQFLASTYCGGNAMDLLGVPITRRDSNWTIKNDTVLSGIYCVAGNIKMQARLTGSAVLVATGTITTSGGNSSLTTADPTGADVLMLAQSTAVKAISLAGEDCTYTGNLVATGGIELSSSETLVDGAMVGQVIVVKGSTNTLDGR